MRRALMFDKCGIMCARKMGIYKIIYLGRDGWPTDTSIYATSKHAAVQEARNRFDDVLKVKRVGSLRGRLLFAGAILLVLAGAIATLRIFL